MPRKKVPPRVRTTRLWIEDIIEAMTTLGGQAHFKALYAEVARIRTVPLPKNWKIIIRNQIDLRSSDSENFIDEKGDLFYSVDGIGSGVWGLRSMKPDRPA